MHCTMTGEKFQTYYHVYLKTKIEKKRFKKMELENIIITSKQPEYKQNETLNFLLILLYSWTWS